jgi:hypothetical protein
MLCMIFPLLIHAHRNKAPALFIIEVGEFLESIGLAVFPLAQLQMIRRPVEDHADLRELVIDFGAGGYLAWYSFDSLLDVLTILAVKHQRKDDYR